MDIKMEPARRTFDRLSDSVYWREGCTCVPIPSVLSFDHLCDSGSWRGVSNCVPITVCCTVYTDCAHHVLCKFCRPVCASIRAGALHDGQSGQAPAKERCRHLSRSLADEVLRPLHGPDAVL